MPESLSEVSANITYSVANFLRAKGHRNDEEKDMLRKYDDAQATPPPLQVAAGRPRPRPPARGRILALPLPEQNASIASDRSSRAASLIRRQGLVSPISVVWRSHSSTGNSSNAPLTFGMDAQLHAAMQQTERFWDRESVGDGNLPGR